MTTIAAVRELAAFYANLRQVLNAQDPRQKPISPPPISQVCADVYLRAFSSQPQPPINTQNSLASYNLVTTLLALTGCDDDSKRWDYFDMGVADAIGVTDVSTRRPDRALPDDAQVLDAEQANQVPRLEEIGRQRGREREELQIQLVAHDNDGDTLTYSMTGSPAGSELDPNTGLFTWTPLFSQAGEYFIRFEVRDEHGATAHADAAITITDVAGDSDEDGWLDAEDCAPNDPNTFPIEEYSTTTLQGNTTICPGTYHGATLTRPLSANAPITINGHGVTLDGDNAETSGFLQGGGGNTTIRGFTFQNYQGYLSSQGRNGAIHFAASNGNTIEDIRMRNVGLGIKLFNSSHNVIRRVSIPQQGVGIAISVHGSEDDAASDNNRSNNNRIEGNELISTSVDHNDYAIVMMNADRNMISSNTIRGYDIGITMGFSVTATSAFNNEFSDNVIDYARRGPGIVIMNGGGNVFINNTVRGSGYGILLGNCPPPTNIFEDNDFGENDEVPLIGRESCADDEANLTNPANGNRL